MKSLYKIACCKIFIGRQFIKNTHFRKRVLAVQNMFIQQSQYPGIESVKCPDICDVIGFHNSKIIK